MHVNIKQYEMIIILMMIIMIIILVFLVSGMLNLDRTDTSQFMYLYSTLMYSGGIVMENWLKMV